MTAHTRRTRSSATRNGYSTAADLPARIWPHSTRPAGGTPIAQLDVILYQGQTRQLTPHSHTDGALRTGRHREKTRGRDCLAADYCVYIYRICFTPRVWQ